jgi:hypothetical protein
MTAVACGGGFMHQRCFGQQRRLSLDEPLRIKNSLQERFISRALVWL